jgi:hypothetical protein
MPRYVRRYHQPAAALVGPPGLQLAPPPGGIAATARSRRIGLGQAEGGDAPPAEVAAAPSSVPTWVWIVAAGAVVLVLVMLLRPRGGPRAYGLRPSSGIIRLYPPKR